MTEFITALMALIATFIHPSSPDNVPPVNKTEFENKVNNVSQLARQLNPPDDHDNGSENQSGNSNDFYIYTLCHFCSSFF